MYKRCEIPTQCDIKTPKIPLQCEVQIPSNPNIMWCSNTVKSQYNVIYKHQKSQYNVMFKHHKTPIQCDVQTQWNPHRTVTTILDQTHLLQGRGVVAGIPSKQNYVLVEGRCHEVEARFWDDLWVDDTQRCLRTNVCLIARCRSMVEPQNHVMCIYRKIILELNLPAPSLQLITSKTAHTAYSK